jgi:predicted component of type VI protein secretion system
MARCRLRRVPPARVLSSEAFAHQILLSEDSRNEPAAAERELSESEVEDWMSCSVSMKINPDSFSIDKHT